MRLIFRISAALQAVSLLAVATAAVERKQEAIYFFDFKISSYIGSRCSGVGKLQFLCGPGGEPVFREDDNRPPFEFSCHQTKNTLSTSTATGTGTMPASDMALICDRSEGGLLFTRGMIRCVGETEASRELVYGGVFPHEDFFFDCGTDQTNLSGGDFEDIVLSQGLQRVCHRSFATGSSADFPLLETVLQDSKQQGLSCRNGTTLGIILDHNSERPVQHNTGRGECYVYTDANGIVEQVGSSSLRNTTGPPGTPAEAANTNETCAWDHHPAPANVNSLEVYDQIASAMYQVIFSQHFCREKQYGTITLSCGKDGGLSFPEESPLANYSLTLCRTGDQSCSFQIDEELKTILDFDHSQDTLLAICSGRTQTALSLQVDWLPSFNCSLVPEASQYHAGIRQLCPYSKLQLQQQKTASLLKKPFDTETAVANECSPIFAGFQFLEKHRQESFYYGGCQAWLKEPMMLTAQLRPPRLDPTCFVGLFEDVDSGLASGGSEEVDSGLASGGASSSNGRGFLTAGPLSLMMVTAVSLFFHFHFGQ